VTLGLALGAAVLWLVLGVSAGVLSALKRGTLWDRGAMVVALGRPYSGLFASDDDWAAEIVAAGERTGEQVWRMPLHDEYKKMIEGRYADIVNSTAERSAGAATAAEFLHRFTGDVPWAHLDIAGAAYDNGKPYTPKGGAGWGVRLLVELARGGA